MFAVEGYVPLAKLWDDFEKKFGLWCYTRAEECYRSDSFAEAEIFGSPRDLCEDLFLRSLEKTNVTLITTDGEVLDAMPVLAGTNARLFEKASVFESFVISQLDEETGPQKEWLVRMGSARFSPSAHADANVKRWLRTRGRDIAEFSADPHPTANVYHTLPFFFERLSFVIPKELPPWASDIVEDAFFRNLVCDVGGAAVCLSSSAAEAWWKRVTFPLLLDLLRMVVKSIHFEASEVGAKPIGRPRKIDLVARTYGTFSPSERRLAWKQKAQLMEERVGFYVSISTLVNAAKKVEGSGEEDT